MKAVPESVSCFKIACLVFFVLLPGFSDWVEKGPEKGTYTVVRYDTMWDLAGRFLGDNYKWEELWEANPHISNPHRIYPGDRIYLPGAKGRAERAPDEPGKDEEQGFEELTGEFLEREEELLTGDRSMTVEDSVYMAKVKRLLNKSVFTKEFLAGIPFLWRDKNPEGVVKPGEGRIVEQEEEMNTIYRKFDVIDIKPDAGTENLYTRGDTLDLYQTIERLSMSNKPVVLVKRNGRAVVKGLKGDGLIKAEVLDVWGVIKTGDRVSKAREFRDYELKSYTDPEKRVKSEVFARAENTATIQPYTNFIIDIGSVNGVEFGDLFYVYRNSEAGGMDDPVMIASVTNVENVSSTCTAVRIFRERFEKGDSAVLYKRAVFK